MSAAPVSGRVDQLPLSVLLPDTAAAPALLYVGVTVGQHQWLAQTRGRSPRT